MRHILLLGTLLLPLGAETYHAACIAFEPAKETIYVSDAFEQECASQLPACRREVMDKWTAFLHKEGFAQSSGATRRCEMYRDGSTPDESPRFRVRKWRDETVAQTQAGPVRYGRVVMTPFELDQG